MSHYPVKSFPTTFIKETMPLRGETEGVVEKII
jgi:hypothetical protein